MCYEKDLLTPDETVGRDEGVSDGEKYYHCAEMQKKGDRVT